ncbi:9091_t:CDS:2 [Entrophospora sp. SA101]|nr:9091_t:CDS:2 [Entrophospora sp. SA101]
MTSLDIIDKNLKGSLNLNDFVNLQSLRSGGNQITSLDLSNFELDLRDNQFTDLTFLGHLENLEEVWLNNNPLINSYDNAKEQEAKEVDKKQSETEEYEEYEEYGNSQANYQQVAAKLDEDRDTNINNEKELSSKKQELVNTKQKLNELLYQEKSLEQTRLLRRTEKELNKKIESLEKGNAKLQGKLTAKEQEISRMNQTINQAVSTPKLNIEGSINVERGNALIDNVIGDNANITSHYTKSVEESEQQAQILHQPYGTPSSSKN